MALDGPTLSAVSEIVSFTSLRCRPNRQHVVTCRQPLSLLATSTPFDFSSPQEWDRFYQERQHNIEDDESTEAPSSNPMEVEWHDSISLQDIANAVPPQSTVLMVGCGTSRLPQTMLEHPTNAPKHMVLLDTSQTCLDQLREIYDKTPSCCNNTTIDYVCGDATRLTDYFGAAKNGKDAPVLFDVIIDKGLTDAILCSEGWDGPLERMFQQAAAILQTGRGKYILISYRLPRTTQEFLVDVSDNVGLEWEFDVDLSNMNDGVKQHRSEDGSKLSRCMVSLATRRRTR